MVDNDDDQTTGSLESCRKHLVCCLGDCHHNSSNGRNSQIQPIDCQYDIHLYLIEKDCGNLSIVKQTPAYMVFVKAVSTVYAKMISNNEDGDDNDGDVNMIAILKEMDLDSNCESLVDDTLPWKY